MKKRYPLFMIVCFTVIALLASCDSQDFIPTEPVAATTPSEIRESIPAETELFSEAVSEHNHTISYSPQRPWSADDWVVTAVEETFTWTDGVGSRNEVTVRLPHLHSGEHFATIYNDSMDAFGSGIIAEIEECMKQSCSTHLISVDYEVWLNGDTLSILTTVQTATDSVEYRVDNFDLDDGEALSVADMCDEYLDLAYPVFLKYTCDRILLDFEEEFSDFIAQFQEDYEFIKQLYLADRSIIRGYQLYLGENGVLMLVCDRPSVAGAAYYAQLQQMAIDPAMLPGEDESWQWLFDLYLSADQYNTEFARDILITAYEEEHEDFSDALKLRPRNEREAIDAAVRVKNGKKG